MPWVFIGIAGAALLTLIVALTMRRSRDPNPRPELTSEQWTAIGFVFVGAGVAITSTQGASGIGMIAVGVLYLVMGYRARHSDVD